MSGPSISTQNLSKRYNREWIFRGLTYNFTSNSVYAITGPNGSGKSTMLQVLWGQVPPSSGTITYQNKNKNIPADKINFSVSIASPYMELIDEFTLLEHLKFHFKLREIRKGILIEELLEIMYMQETRDKLIGNFSSGMKQRVKLALALYTKADFIFLDEPGTNLDQKAFDWYKTELQKIASDIIFIASNNPEEYPSKATILNLLDHKK